MLSFDLTAFYPLLSAFDQTGRRMFGDQWRGIEAFACRVDDPKATKDERNAIAQEIKMLAINSIPHQTVFNLDETGDDRQKAVEALYLIRMETSALKEKLATLPNVSDTWVSDREAYARRCKVEKELWSAFSNKDIELYMGTSRLADTRSWLASADFKLYFGLSMARIPLRYSSQPRRQPVFVKKVAFDNWLDRFGPISGNEAELKPEVRIKAWLQEMVRKHKPKERTLDSYLAQAQEEIPNLSKRRFLRVWSSTVPESWKAKGRPKLVP